MHAASKRHLGDIVLCYICKTNIPPIVSDYIRTFTWDKKLEMVVKSTGILGGQGNSSDINTSFPLH